MVGRMGGEADTPYLETGVSTGEGGSGKSSPCMMEVSLGGGGGAEPVRGISTY